MALLLLGAVPAFTCETTPGAHDEPWSVLANLPTWALPVFTGADFAEAYRISYRHNPFLVSGDFNGDGHLDLAVRVEARSSGEGGIFIVHAGDQGSFLLGAGQSFGNGGKDFRWIGSWYTFPQGPVDQNHDSGPPPELLGDAVMVVAPEAASALIYWNGSAYGWYQQGD